jgi:hypothetical protein
VLADILRSTAAMPVPPELLVGIESGDDAARVAAERPPGPVATTDFFMPIVDDPHDFGRIAATNALSDVYAMGGRPILALALVACRSRAVGGDDRAHPRGRRRGVPRRRRPGRGAGTRSTRSRRSTGSWRSGSSTRSA